MSDIINGKTLDGISFEYSSRVKPVTTTSKTPDVPQGRDTFNTPRYAVDILVPFIPKHITHIWECAAGEGRIVRYLRDAGYKVMGTDIRTLGDSVYCNFVEDNPPKNIYSQPTAIITNPPYSIKEMFIEKAIKYNIPMAMLINADYSGQQIKWIEEWKCEKIIPKRRINYITPNMVNRINEGENTNYSEIDEIPQKLIAKYSASQFHSMWLTWGFGLNRTETFVELTNKQIIKCRF